MNSNDIKPVPTSQVDASCRLPLLALFGGSALWLVLGLLLELTASLQFHAPGIFSCCPWMTYGRVLPAANDLLVYGFAIPTGMGVMLWVVARLGQVELVLPLVSFAGANVWHLGVLAGTLGVLSGHSTGYAWFEYPRVAAALLLPAFMLVAVSAVAAIGQRRIRDLYPSHWFFLASLLWFPWIYSTAFVFLLVWPVRGVAQAVIDWWFASNLIVVWLSLVGLGISFYLLPKYSGRPLEGRFTALFAFVTLLLFGSWLGIPQGAPVPFWLPASSILAGLLFSVPVLVVALVFARTVCGAPDCCKGGPFCQVKFGTAAFVLSGIWTVAQACPQFAHSALLTTFDLGRIHWQIFGFFAITVMGGFYELFPRVMGSSLPLPGLPRFQHWLFISGALVLAASLAVAGLQQQSADFILARILPALRASSLGWTLLLIGSLIFALNVFIMTIVWVVGIIKTVIGAIKAPLAVAEVKP